MLVSWRVGFYIKYININLHSTDVDPSKTPPDRRWMKRSLRIRRWDIMMIIGKDGGTGSLGMGAHQ